MKEIRQAYKEGYLMAIKHLKDTYAIETKLSEEETIQMLELSANSIEV